MVLWIFPGCPLTSSWPSFLSISLLLLLSTLADLIILTSQTSHHFGLHTVNTKYGALRGVRLQFTSSSAKHLDPVVAFLGIPYASPPINAYRFMPPVAPLPWGGVRLAVNLPPACPQRFPDISNETVALQIMTSQRYNFLLRLKPYLANQSEDCLYLNIYVPSSGEEIRPGKYAIVLVIHGESWEWGSGNEFDGGILASLGNHIVVTFNYRLGILGFLRTSNQQSNFGLLDVIAALHWVRENGDAFGGDRNRITLLGYRSGAVVANLLLIAPIAKGLFHRAILISGSVLSPWALQRKPEEIAAQVSVQLGCVGRLPLSHPESDLAPCLRRKHLSDLMNFVPESPRFLSPFAPFVDNILIRNPKVVMEKDPLEQFKRSELILVFTTSESAHELNKHELTHGFEADHKDRILRTLVRNVFSYHQQEIFSIVKNEYTDWERPIPHPIPLRDSTVEALSDCLVIAPALQVALIHGRRGAKTHLLHFSHVSREYDFSSYERLGSLEGDVVPYMMGLPVTNNMPALGGPSVVSPWSSLANFSKQDAVVSETIIHYFANFAKSGDPNVNERDPVSAIGLTSGGGGSSSSSNSGAGASHNTDDSGSSHHDWVGGSNSLSSSSALSQSSSSSSSGSSGSSRERIRSRYLYWDAFDANSQLYLNIGTKPRMRSHYRGHKMALWLNLIPQIHLPGGPDVTMAHHSFPDDNPDLYIGPFRPLMHLADQGGIGGRAVESYSGGNQHGPTLPPGMSVITTECPEGTDPPFPQGTRHTVARGDLMDAEKDGSPSSRHSNNANELPEMGLGMSTMSGEYDYATALTVTMTVGICLILLNVLVFAAIMCRRKRGLSLPPVPSHPPSSGPDGRTGGGGGLQLKSPYHQDDYKWSSGTNEFPDHLSSYGEVEETLEGIGLSQYPAAACAQLDLKPMSTSNCNSLMRPGRSPSPFIALSPQKSDRGGSSSIFYGDGSGGGEGSSSMAAPTTVDLTHTQRRMSAQMPMTASFPDCVGGAGNPILSSCPMFRSHNEVHDSPPISSSIRLYLNQSAGDEDTYNMPKPPRSCSNSCSNTLTRSSGRGDGGMQIHNPGGQQQQQQQHPVTSNPSSNPSPSGGTGTLVGVLKRHSGTTPNSTVKKRVQIQEISV